jgi:hypothetical protein
VPRFNHHRAAAVGADAVAHHHHGANLEQRGASVLAYIDGFWLCFRFAITVFIVVASSPMRRRGPFTPAPFKFVKMRRPVST